MRDYHHPIFLHFINRELLLLKRLTLEQSAHIKLIKNCGLMSPEPLVAPFAQVSELYWGKKKIQVLIAQLCANQKLDLINGSTGLYEFIETRKALYGSRRDRYPMYFGKRTLSSDGYKASRSLDTTNFIRRTIVGAVQSEALGASNIISSEEVSRLRLNSNSIQAELHERGPAATFSMYEVGSIAPKPDEVRFIGKLSSRLFVQHYSSEHNLVVPTGFFSDHKIEDYDRFPLYDVHINAVLIGKLGLERTVSDEDFHQPYINIVGDREFPEFCELRLLLMRALADAVKEKGDRSTHKYALTALLQSLDFGVPRTSQPPNARMLSSRIELALKRASSTHGSMARAFKELKLQEDKTSKVLVATATDLEDEIFRATAAYCGFLRADVLTFKDVSVAEYRCNPGLRLFHLRTSAGSSGLHSSQRIAEKALEHLGPSHVFAVGIAFGLDQSKQSEADVMVAEYVFSYERQKIEDSRVTWRGDRVPCASGPASFARHFASRSFKVHVGGIFSGEKLVNSKEYRDLLSTLDPKCIGGEMEGAGFVTACLAEGVPFSLVKGISDFAVNKDDKVQERAARNAFTFFFDALAKLDDGLAFRR